MHSPNISLDGLAYCTVSPPEASHQPVSTPVQTEQGYPTVCNTSGYLEAAT